MQGCLAASGGERGRCSAVIAAEALMAPTTLLPWQPDGLTPAQIAAVSYLARYSGPTHALYAYQLRRWFGWCESNGLDPLTGVQRAHVELSTVRPAEPGLQDCSTRRSRMGATGSSRSAQYAGLITPDQ